MWKAIGSLFILLFMLVTSVIGQYNNKPYFRSDNGHLYVDGATSRNISLSTKGRGFINVNNENLLQIIGLAKEAWEVIEAFQSNDLSEIAETIKNVVPTIEGPRGLSSRVTALEMQILNASSKSLTKGKGRTTFNADRLEVRLTNLEKKITNLINLLSISECLSNPCQNGGTCMDLYNGFQCNCPKNWQGRICELDVDECVRFVHTDLGCQNGAECKNTPGSYECVCATNWFGLHCTKRKNDCNAATSSELCGNGVCINQPSAVGYTCICNQGWITDGAKNPACTKDVDECKENKHTCSANPPVECRNTRGSFTCGNCPTGYEGDGFVCTDVNECLINNGGCSVNPRVQCLNTRGSFKCELCPPGYSGDGFNCVYISGGACAIDNGGCHPNAECTVYAGTTIQCTCRQGYNGNGVGVNGCIKNNKAATDPCLNNPCGTHGVCLSNSTNSFLCHCNIGYTGRTCNIRVENPCLVNPCVHGECVPEPGSGEFNCNCYGGYSGPLCESFLDVCGGYLTTFNGSIQFPQSNTTLKYQSNMNCVWLIAVNLTLVININFVWIDIEKSNACSFDYVEIKNINDEDEKVLDKFCGNTLPLNNNIISDSDSVIVHFQSDGSKNFRGFQLNYTSILPECGGTLNIDSHGTLSSPGSPGKYPPNRDCYWTLNAVPGKRIQLNFFSLSFEQHINCSYDYLEIRDGFTQHSPILAKLCNTTKNSLPPPIITSSSHASLHFHSDSFGQDYGFQMTYSTIEGVPGCGGIYTSLSGIISFPVHSTSDIFNDLDSLNCEWHIRMPLKQKLKLEFIKKFGIKYSSKCSTDFLEIHDGPSIKSPLIGRYCGSTRHVEPIITISNEVTLIFVSNLSSTIEGFTIKYETLCGGKFLESSGIIESPFYPNPYPQEKICEYLIEQPVGKAIRLSFLDMEIGDPTYPKCSFNSLEIRDGDNANSTKIALLCGNVEKLPKLPYISTHNYMWLKFSKNKHFVSNKGFRANYSTIDISCGGILKEPSGIIQSPKNPEIYLQTQMCTWIISANKSSQIQINWLSFSLDNNLTCNNDYVEIYENSVQGNASKIAKYCGAKVPPTLTSLGNRLTIVFKTDRLRALDGFMLNYTSLNKAQECGGNFFVSEGFIMSPNFPNHYPNQKDCIWTINVPVTNQIELNITKFELENSVDCSMDFVEIRNGGYPTSPLIGKYCGSKILSIISSSGNVLFIRFVSDDSLRYSGFFIQWYITSKGCGGTFNSGKGHIVSPNYPLPVLETLECYYKISVMQGSQINLSILDIQLVTDNVPGLLCKDDFLELYDGGSSASKLLGTFCNDTHLPQFVHSTSNQMYIKFRSSGFSKGRGFSLTYNTDCHVSLKGYQGAIEILKEENANSNTCVWTIVAPIGSKINITFTEFKISRSIVRELDDPDDDDNDDSLGLSNSLYRRYHSSVPHEALMLRFPMFRSRSKSFFQCVDTKLIITEGVNRNEINSVLWKNNCSIKPHSVISSTKNIVRITYNSLNEDLRWDKFNNFRIEWIVDGCGGVLNQLRGEFTSPEYPRFYSSNTTCEWNIITDAGNIIEITIEELWFETSGSCLNDSIAIYSGYDDSGSELLRLCHKQTNPITLTSSGNEAFVRFQSVEFLRKRFKATYRTIESKCGGRFTAPQGIIYTNNYPQNYDSHSSCTWYIEVAKTHLINLTFIDFSTQSSPPGNNDIVLVYEDNIHGKLLLNHSGNSLPPPVISSSNMLFVSFEVGKHDIQARGFKAKYLTACGAKLITSDSGIITNNPYFTNGEIENCTWTIISDTIQSKVTLTFTHIDIVHYLDHKIVEKSNITDRQCSKNLFHTIFRILDGPDSDAPEILKFCKSDPIPPPIVSNGPAMRIEFTDNSGALDSFTAMYSVRSVACGGTYDSIRGTISSPNYPNNYFRDSECVWILKSSVGNLVALNFIAFELEEDEFCNEDYVEVREGDSIGPVLGIFCGLNLPSNITSGSTLWVKFRSNSLDSAKGFTADFKYVTEIYKSQQSGKISSPMYPKTYRDSEDYSWTITVDQAKQVQIVINDLISTSEFHELKIYDGSNVEALILFELTSINDNLVLNKTIISTDNTVLIRLKAGDKRVEGIRFLLSWTQIDGLDLDTLYPTLEYKFNSTSFDYYLSPSSNLSVTITSPGYPHGYAPNLNVTWILHTEPYYHIDIELIDIDFYPFRSSSNIHRGDYLDVVTVDPDTAKTMLLKTVYTNIYNVNETNIVGKNKVILTFISDKSLNGTGFKVKAKLQCGGQLRGPTGVISFSNTSSLFDSLHSYKLHCNWNITVRPGRTILVKLMSIQLSSLDRRCVDNYVLLKNGLYEDSSYIGNGKYCNEINESTLSTTDNKLQINAVLFKGDKFKIAFEEISINCGGQIYLNDVYSNTQITSPSYPNIPPAHIECIWTVVAPPAERISITIEDLDLSDTENCEKEYLEFRDGAARFSRLISHICQSPEITDIETTDKFLSIKYFTDLNVPSNGFKLNVSVANCGGTRRAARGKIFSPNYPKSYESNMDCEYKIVAGFNMQVLLKFETVNLKRRYPGIGVVEDKVNNVTYDDTLTIFDVDPLTKTRVKLLTIVGSDLPSNYIKSSDQELIIKFKSPIINGPFRENSTQGKFVISYDTDYIDCHKNYDVESGEIISPVYSNLKDGRFYCVYKIKVPKGRRITVEIMKGKSNVQNCETNLLPENKLKEKLKVYQSVVWKNVCIDPVINPLSLNYMFESISNEMTLVHENLLKSENLDSIRLKFSSDKPSICGGITDASVKGNLEFPIKNLTKGYCQWVFTNTNGTIVISTNFNINESQLPCREENIHLLIATNEDNSELLKSYCPISNTNDKFTILSPLPVVELAVLTNIRKINFTATIDYNVNSCGGVIKGQKITITSSNYPKNYGQNVKCAWILELPEGNNVDIRFNDIDLDSSCDNNYVMIHDGRTSESPVLGKYCGNILPENLIATSNELWIEFSSENGKINRKGFNLTLESRQSGCGNIYALEEGELSTRNYPDLYPNNDECEWIIAVLPGNRIGLKFVERFNLEQSVNCTKDYVQVYDFINDMWTPLGSRLCGRQIPPQFNSSETKLKIRLRTDSDIQGDGFKAKWTSLCGGVFTQNTGKIISPNYPKHYRNDLECNYTISAPGEEIKLVFNSFEMEDHGCRFDNLTIYNKIGALDGQTRHFVGSYCGNNAPHPMTFKNSVMMIFKTDFYFTLSGFEIQYAVQKCGGEITSPGIIKSPKTIDELFGNTQYPDDANCTWIIRAPPDQVVQLVFTKFRLERSMFDFDTDDLSRKCLYDSVVVFDESNMNSNNSQDFGIYCGVLDTELPTFTSKTNTVYVQFVSDSSRGNEGFEAEINFTYGEFHGCGGTIRLDQSNNMTSSYTLNNPNISVKTDLDCGWLILVKPSYVVQMQVVSYTETPKCSSNATNCLCSSVQMYDGPGRSALKIRQFCPGNDDYIPLLSSGSEAFIRYLSIASDVDAHFEIKITAVTSVCGPSALIATNQTQVLTSVNYPLPYNKNNLICTWYVHIESEGQPLMLRFTNLNLEDTKDCSSNYLEIQYKPLLEWSSSTFRICHEDHVFDFASQPSRMVKLLLHTVVDQKTPKGFRLEYMTTSCLTAYTKRYGSINLRLDQQNMKNEECIFSINPGQSNLTISLFITPLRSLWGRMTPKSNHLKFYDGPSVSSPLISTLTDKMRSPYAVSSTGPSLTIACNMTSEFAETIDMSYTSTDQGRGCGGKLYNMYGTLTSPMYPTLYNKNSTCRWDVAVPRPNPVNIYFGVFNLGSRMTCDTDYLEIYNVDQLTGASSFVAKYCGDDIPAPHTSETGAVFIRYVTTVRNTGTGWILYFDTKDTNNY